MTKLQKLWIRITGNHWSRWNTEYSRGWQIACGKLKIVWVTVKKDVGW
jgi:hypothetical protein